MKLNARNKAAFGFGGFGKDVVYMLVSGYLLYYYNSVLGMSSVFIGAVLMGARIFDAINDPIMGVIVAKTNTRFGRFRPWILAGTVLNAVVLYALFAVPSSMGDGGARVWLTVFYLAWGVTYTLMDIPYWSMIPAITEPGRDREQMSSLARACAGIGDAVPTVLTMVIVPILSGSSVIADYRIGFQYWALIIAIVFVISEAVCVFNVPEKKPESMEAVGIGKMFTSLVKNDQAMAVVATVIMVYTSLNIVANLILYFFQYDVGNTDSYSVFVGVCFLAQVVAMALIPAISKAASKQNIFKASIAIQIAGLILVLVFAYTNLYRVTSWAILCLPGVMVYAAYGMMNVMLTVFLSDTVDYGEWKYGSREESVIFSMQTFTVKLASGVAVFIAGIAIDVVGLQTDAVTQSAATLNGLRVFMTIPSVVLMVVAYIIFRKCYKLTDEKMNTIMGELNDKSASEGEIAND
ncbi:MAG: glycoside-pentoside-hexuronide (GPH):cation symporter [Eubacterium sp.]|nr:glycoside-pentoside-hexuronide (GPH):cation symporter [Eubacterium sp.]